MVTGPLEHLASCIIVAVSDAGKRSLNLKELENFLSAKKKEDDERERLSRIPVRQPEGHPFDFALHHRVAHRVAAIESPRITYDKIQIWSAMCQLLDTSPLTVVVKIPPAFGLQESWRKEAWDSDLHARVFIFFKD